MKLEDQVCSLEYAKKLKELGVKQESAFSWCKPSEDDSFWKDENQKYKDFQLYFNYENFPYVNICDDGTWNSLSLDGCGCCEDNAMLGEGYSAFTVAELGAMLPNEFKFGTTIYRNIAYDEITSVLVGGAEKIFMCDTEANARAQMLIYLLENGLIKNDSAICAAKA